MSFHEASWIGPTRIAYTDTNFQATLKEWDHVTRAGRSNYKPFWGRCQFPQSTHCCIFQRANFGGKLVGNEVRPFGTHSQKSEIFSNRRYFTRTSCKAGEKYEFYASEMSSGLPCALRNWQRLQLVSRWRLSSHSFSADRLLTFIVYLSPVEQFTSRALGYVSFDIFSYHRINNGRVLGACMCFFVGSNVDWARGGCGALTVARAHRRGALSSLCFLKCVPFSFTLWHCATQPCAWYSLLFIVMVCYVCLWNGFGWCC